MKLWECKCSVAWCGFVARSRRDDEAAAWCWTHELRAHDLLPDFKTLHDRTETVEAAKEVGFPGTPSAIEFIPPARRFSATTA